MLDWLIVGAGVHGVHLAELSLPCAACGYPLVDRALRWHGSADGPSPLFVTGPLAELEVGPVSRNIQGARLAARRITQAA